MKYKMVAAAGVAVVALTGCSASGGGVKTSADHKSSGTSSSSKSQAPPQSKKVPAKLGDSITLKGNNGGEIAVTAIKVVDPVRSTDGFSTPDAGNRYFAVQFSIKDTGQSAYDDSPANGAKVVDTQSQQFSADITLDKSTAGPGLPAETKLAPGDQALGYLVFQVPKAAKVAKVQFSQSSGFGDTGEWVVS